LIHGFQYINTDNSIAVIDCRLYAGKSRYSSQIIAAIWIHDWKDNRFSHGVGTSGGCGYHKGSQAIENALKDMGITLDHAIGGKGYDACKAAFASIMKALGYPSFSPESFVHNRTIPRLCGGISKQGANTMQTIMTTARKVAALIPHGQYAVTIEHQEVYHAVTRFQRTKVQLFIRTGNRELFVT
jgi:hypothetical protein